MIVFILSLLFAPAGVFFSIQDMCLNDFINVVEVQCLVNESP